VTTFDNPVAPTIFEALIAATGATPIDWPRRLECCGNPLHDASAALSARITRAKIIDAVESGADVLCTACPHCHQSFDAAQSGPDAPVVRTLLYPQLLGLALGLPKASLGL
jgi:heterodisulfide reductase subunit B